MTRRFDRKKQYDIDDTLPFIADTNDLPVELARLEIGVKITGLFAETTQVFTLHNPNGRDLEGTLVFPLPDDAVVCGYAIDVEGRLVDGVVVPKHEARRILEAEIRKGVDPGLVEQVQGNVYRTRIYPLPARGTRTVKIVYISRLTIDSRAAAYHLPLGHASAVDHVSLRVEVTQSPVEPALVGSIGNLTIAPFEQRWVAETELRDQQVTDDLHVRLPDIPDHLTMVENHDGESFFCISSVPQRATPHEGWNPARIAVLWDSSGSRSGGDKDIGLLRELSSRWNHVTFDVQVLRDVVEAETHTFVVDGGDCTELERFLKAQPRDGATNLAAIDTAVTPHPDDEAWLVFSDGMGTIGTGMPSGRSPRVFTVTSQPQCDAALLQHLATRTGGAFFNLVTTSVDQAASAIATWSDALRVARTAGCEDVHVTRQNGRLTVVGRLIEDVASVFLEGPGAPTDQLGLARAAATPGRNLARAWAGQQAQLLEISGVDKRRVADLGRRFGLVTPGTSLLVLETLDQYLEYDIEPPDTLPHVRHEFLARRRQVAAEHEDTEQRQLERVLSMWERRIEWWTKEYDPAPKQKHDDTKGGYGEGDGRGMQRSRMHAPGRLGGAPLDAAEMEMEESAYDDDFAVGAAADFAPAASMAAPAPEPMKKESYGGSAGASIQIQPWSADTPYLNAMKAAGAAGAYDCYLNQRDEFGRSPAFFLDCAHHLLSQEQRALGIRVLSNLLELALEDPPLLRMYAWRMQHEGEFDQAVAVFERVLAERDDEPQSHRDLALALEQRWQRDGNAEDATRAMSLLWDVVRREWDRFPEIEIIALMELNRLIHLTRRAGIETPAVIDERFIKLLDLDVRISMSWDADLTDVDLHVFEPTGEHAYYGHNLTEIGGLVSRDFTQGYGPEEYVLRRAVPGEYTIKTHYYGSHQQTLTGACTVIVNVFTNYGRDDEQRQVLTLRLEQASDQVTVGTIRIE